MSKENVQLDPAAIWSMSEDELSQINPADLETQEEVVEEQSTEEATQENPEETEQEQTEESEEPEEELTEENSEEAEQDTTTTDPKPGKDKAQTTDKPATEAGKPDPSSPSVPDYKEFYESILGTPIKANGKDITLKSKEDVVQLIQMGANYHQKMAALKPVRRVVSMLEENGIKSDSDIGFLIDLHKKNPEAIAKLVKDSGIDLFEFNVDQGDSYKSQHQAPSDKQMELTDVISDLTTTSPGFKDMFNNILQSWDVESQNHLADNPGLFKVLETARSNGNYDLVMQSIEQDRVMGRIPAGVPMLQVYSHYEQELQKAGRLNMPKPLPTPNAQQATMSQLKNAQVTSPATEAKRKASSPRSTPAGKSPTPKDIFSLSAEEFAKIDPTQFN